MLIFFSKCLVKLCEVWLWQNSGCEVIVNGGSRFEYPIRMFIRNIYMWFASQSGPTCQRGNKIYTAWQLTESDCLHDLEGWVCNLNIFFPTGRYFGSVTGRSFLICSHGQFRSVTRCNSFVLFCALSLFQTNGSTSWCSGAVYKEGSRG